MPYLLTLGGFVLLLFGGEVLVRGAVALARRFGLSELLVGLTVVAFGTSAPELVVSVGSAMSGLPDIAVGNVVGSNICNISLILGLAALVKPVVVDRADIKPDAYAMMGATLALAALAATGDILRWQGAVLFTALIIYLVWSYRRERGAGTTEDDWRAEETREFESEVRPTLSVLMVIAGVGALVVGADWLVQGATSIAESLGVPDAVVALTVVALGTSMPELATSVVAARRGHADVAVGNVLGSNLFNVLSILGITAMIAPVEISERIATVDVPIMVGLSAVAVAALVLRGSVARWLGAAFFSAYVVYVVALYGM